MSSLGEVIRLPGVGEIVLAPRADGGVFFAIHANGLSVRLPLELEQVVELRESLVFSAMAARANA